MLIEDAEEFERQLRRLCAGFEVPLTQLRKEAYDTGMAKMSIGQFARCVEYALGEHGPDKFPTTNKIWTIHRRLRAPAQASAQPEQLPNGVAGPSIQEQLCDYAALRLHGHIKPLEYSLPWTYVYRQWIDEEGRRCANCIGVVIELKNGKKIGYSTSQMLADTEGHARVMQRCRPGPKPTEAQVRAYAEIGVQLEINQEAKRLESP